MLGKVIALGGVGDLIGVKDLLWNVGDLLGGDCVLLGGAYEL